jgi:phosphoribosylformylglycinamidine synthase
MYKAVVIVKRRPSILDPQGKAAEKGAQLLGFNNVKDTRIGKYIEFYIDAKEKESAENEVKLYSEKLLSNPIMEDYEYHLDEVKNNET